MHHQLKLFTGTCLICILPNMFFIMDNYVTPDRPYLGQNPPGMTPEIFAPGIISSGCHETDIVLSINPVVDLHFHVRSLFSTRRETSLEYTEIVKQVQEFETAFGSPIGWGFIEPLLTRCKTAGELESWTERLPQRFRLLSGTIVKPRDVSAPYAKALAKAESAFMGDVWPDHRRIIEKARKSMEKLLEDGGTEAIEYCMKQLDMDMVERTLNINLVADAPSPDASTSASRGIGVVSFVGVSNFSGSGLAEVILHEAIHALDLQTRGKPTVLNRLRQMIRDTGLQPNHPLNRDIPHMVIFVQAGETVRRLIDPEYDPYTAAQSFYKRAPEAANRVLPNWKAYLNGSVNLDETLRSIIKGLEE